MAINFPSSLDSLTNPTTSSPLNSPSHAGQHSDANDAIEALQAKVGANSSAVTTSHDYKLSTVTGSNKAETQANKENSTIDTSTTKYPTVNLLKTVKDTIPVKATGAEINTGTDDEKFATAKALADQTVLEKTANKETSALDTSTTKYPCNNVVKSAVDGKMANPMTTAGDIIYGGASGTPTRLGVGTAGQVLTMNAGATAPEWADASGGGGDISVSLGKNNKTSVSANNWGNVSFNVEYFDTDGMHDSTNPERIKIKTAGKYHISWIIRHGKTGEAFTRLTKNGSEIAVQTSNSTDSSRNSSTGSILLDLSVNDYLIVQARATTSYDVSDYFCYFSAYKIN